MTKGFLTLAAVCAMFLLLLLATNNTGNPALLSTVEYGIDTQAAVQDRAAERTHNERMAEIAAEEYAVRMEHRTMIVLGVGGILALGILGGAMVYGAVSRPKVVVMLEGKEHAARIIDYSHEPPTVIDSPHIAEVTRRPRLEKRQ